MGDQGKLVIAGTNLKYEFPLWIVYYCTDYWHVLGVSENYYDQYRGIKVRVSNYKNLT